MMTPDERQRSMDFILRQQAQFAVNMEQLTTRMDRFGARMDQLTSALGQEREFRIQGDTRLEALVIQLAEIARLQSSRLDRCDDRLDEHAKRLNRPNES
jgi:hypothetical protein